MPIFVVTEKPCNQLRRVRTHLSRDGYEVRESFNACDVISYLFQDPNGLVIIDETSQDSSEGGIKKAEQIRRYHPHAPIILITSLSSEHLAIAALKAGVNDYFTDPFSIPDLRKSIERWAADSNPFERLNKCPTTSSNPSEGPLMIGESERMRWVRSCIHNMATSESTVLITGETGTGKDLAAELIHRTSSKHTAPFVRVNCAAIPESLFESELFGYEKGAFTGAERMRKGKFEQAAGGTILLDEIGEINTHAQAKLLRVIETKELYRLGGEKSIPFSARIIASTNQELDHLVEEGKFRADLYYRLNIARIHLPPLRERKEDIPSLLTHYIRNLQPPSPHEVEGFTTEAKKALVDYEWPGNVRELRNFLEATFVNSLPTMISFENFPEHFLRKLQRNEGPIQNECSLLIRALVKTNWNKSKAAQNLKWSRMTLYRKMEKYGITKVFH